MSENAGSDTSSAPVETSSGVDQAEGLAETDNNEVTGETPAEKKAEVIQLKRKLKLVVDGQEIEDEIDWNDEDKIRRQFQKGYAAEKRIAEAKAIQAQAMAILKAAESGDEAFFERLGPKGREMAEKFLLKKIQEDMMTPEEKERRERDAKLSKYEQEEAKKQEEEKSKAQAALEAKYANEYQQTIINALEKSGLPKSPNLVKRMASIMEKNLKLGLELTADDLVHEVKNETTGFLKALVKDAEGDQLVALFGEDIANKIRKFDLKKLQEKNAQVFQSRQVKNEPTQSREKPKRPMTIDEWKEMINKRVNE